MNRMSALLLKLLDCILDSKYQQAKKMFIGDALSRLHKEVQKDLHNVLPLKFLQNFYTAHIYTIMNIWHTPSTDIMPNIKHKCLQN